MDALPSRDPRQRFVDIIENIDAIQRSTHGLSREQFLADADKVEGVGRKQSAIFVTSCHALRPDG